MKSKIIRILIVIVILIIIGIVIKGILVKKATQVGEGGEAVVPVNNAEEQGPEKPAEGIGKMNDDIYIELMACNNYELQKDPTAWVSTNGWNNFLKKKGVTNEQLNAYQEKIAKNPNHYMELTKAIADRIQELQAGN